jgi:transcriptional regulator with XRE-family HTH domain
MVLDSRSSESLSSLGQVIRKRREDLGWTQERLADSAGYSDKIIRNVEHGIRTKLQTIKDVCVALKLPDDVSVMFDNSISDPIYGSYNLRHYTNYVGIYFGFRRDLPAGINFKRSIFEISWSRSKKCLEFVEDCRYTDSNGKTVDLAQSGDIYINNEVNLLHLLTSSHGAIGLITLSMLTMIVIHLRELFSRNSETVITTRLQCLRFI